MQYLDNFKEFKAHVYFSVIYLLKIITLLYYKSLNMILIIYDFLNFPSD